MSTAWIAETRQNQDRRERLNKLTSELANIWFREFPIEVEKVVAELNKQYPANFSGELRVSPSAGIELKCGPNPVFEASLVSGILLKVTRYRPLGKLGRWKSTPDHYTARLDNNENLYFESKSGQPIPCDGMSRELFAYLTDPIT